MRRRRLDLPGQGDRARQRPEPGRHAGQGAYGAAGSGFDVSPDVINLAIRSVREHYAAQGVPSTAPEAEQRKAWPVHLRVARAGPTTAMAAAGVVCLQEFGQYDDSRIPRSMDVVTADIARFGNPGNHNGHLPFDDPYTLYYVGQALYQVGGSRWQENYPRLRSYLVASQRPDGSWTDDKRRHGKPGKLFGTSVACFILAIPNRYLPILQEGKIKVSRQVSAQVTRTPSCHAELSPWLWYLRGRWFGSSVGPAHHPPAESPPLPHARMGGHPVPPGASAPLAPLARLRDLLLLTLRTLALALFGLALARPFFAHTAANAMPNQPIHAVVVVDNSLSMGYQLLDGSVLLDRAKGRVREFLEDLPEGSLVSLIPLCGGPAGFSQDAYRTRQDARDALEQIQVVDRAASAAQMIDQAAEAAPPSRDGKQASDLRRGPAARQLAGRVARRAAGPAAGPANRRRHARRDREQLDRGFRIQDGIADLDTPALFTALIRHEGRPTPGCRGQAEHQRQRGGQQAHRPGAGADARSELLLPLRPPRRRRSAHLRSARRCPSPTTGIGRTIRAS